MNKINLSVCIVTYNEEHNIAACLESVSFANEIIVVDSFSTDNTVQIAKQFTDKVFLNKWEGCGVQKKYAVELATNPWVLILDADERVSTELQQEIIRVLGSISNNSTAIAGYKIPFRSFYCGKLIRFGDWIAEKHLRLFNKQLATVIPRLIHFRITLNAPTNNSTPNNSADTATSITGRNKYALHTLKHCIYHYSYPNLEKVLAKVNHYSTDGAQHKYTQHKRASILKAVARGWFTFIRGYILKLGFLDGKYGLMLAISNAEGAYYKYAKLMLLHNKGAHNPL